MENPVMETPLLVPGVVEKKSEEQIMREMNQKRIALAKDLLKDDI